MNVTALAGGVGGAKLLVGLARALSHDPPIAIVNTGDDDVIYGANVSPDLDIVTYWLAGIADTERGWGIRGDTFHVVDALRELGIETWFKLGDRDFATCWFRTRRLADGATLSAVTDEIRDRLGVAATILPMSDDPVRTRVVTADGRTLAFQDYFVKQRQEPEIAEVRFAGIADAKPGPGVVEAIEDADLVVLCPSNPVVSIGPILALPGVREALRRHRNTIAVSPIIRGAALKGPAGRMLPSVGAEVSAAGVAGLYADFCNAFVVDVSEHPTQEEEIRDGGIDVIALDTIMVDHDASERLARAILDR